MIKRAAASLLSMLLVAALCAGAGVPRPPKDYYYGDGSGAIPAVAGTFIQPWLCAGWTDDRWDSHLDVLLAAGIDTVVLQWTADTPGGEFAYTGFPIPADWAKSAAGFTPDGGVVEGLLKSAQKKGVKVFLGLNTSEEWWNNAFTQQDWCDKQAAAGNAVAAELYRLYKAKYPDAFHGWYWPWEMYGNSAGYAAPWAGMMNASLDFLTGLDASLPVLFSPFMSSYIRLNPQQEQRMWTDFFASAHLRDGDIFCPQDSAGAADFTLSYVDEHLAAMKAATDTKPGLQFWVNSETFTRDFQPATLDRFVSQLYISGKYTDTHLCFAYSHYYSPDQVNPSFDRAYRAFLASGQPDTTPPAPPAVTTEASPGARSVAVTVTPADPEDYYIITIYRGNRPVSTHAATEVSTGSYSYTAEVPYSPGAVYSATVTDCWGNVSGMGRCTLP